MAYDEGLAFRVREVLAEQDGLVEKKMFGGLAFMVRGNLALSVIKDELLVRVGSDGIDSAVTHPHARQANMAGRIMKGWVMITAEGCTDDEDLEAWVKRGVDFALSLPPK